MAKSDTTNDKKFIEFSENLSEGSFLNSLLFNLFGAKPAGVFYDINAETLKKQVQRDLDSLGISVGLNAITFEKEIYNDDEKPGFSIVIWLPANSKHLSFRSDDTDSIYNETNIQSASKELKALVNLYCDDANKKRPLFTDERDNKVRAIKLSEIKFLGYHFDASNKLFINKFSDKNAVDKDITVIPRFDRKSGEFISCRVTIEKPRAFYGKRKTGKAFKIR